jgi:hypothetical protein
VNVHGNRQGYPRAGVEDPGVAREAARFLLDAARERSGSKGAAEVAAAAEEEEEEEARGGTGIQMAQVVVVVISEVGRYAGLRDTLGTAHAGALPARWRLVLLAPDALHLGAAPGPEAGRFSPEAGRFSSEAGRFSPEAGPNSHGDPETAAPRLRRREGGAAAAARWAVARAEERAGPPQETSREPGPASGEKRPAGAAEAQRGGGAGAGAGAVTLLLLLANALLLLALLRLHSGRVPLHTNGSSGAGGGLDGVGRVQPWDRVPPLHRAGRRDAALDTLGAPASDQ